MNSGQTDPDDRIAGRNEGSSCMARARNGGGQRPPRLKPGVKREQIIEVATEYFGQLRATKTRSGLTSPRRSGSARPPSTTTSSRSSTACSRSWSGRSSDFSERFERITAENDDWTEALVAVLVDGVQPHRAADPPPPRDGRRVRARRRAALAATGRGGPLSRPRADARARVRLGHVPRPRHAAGARCRRAIRG